MLLILLITAARIMTLPYERVQAPTHPFDYIPVTEEATPLKRSALSLCEKWCLPGVALCVIRADRTVEIAVAGVRKAGRDGAVQKSDLFHLGSMTKAMTATMIGTLVDDGFLRWDMTLGDGFPEFADSMCTAYVNVTLEQLLTHTSGLPRYTTDQEWQSIPSYSGTPTQQRLAFTRTLLAGTPLGPAGVYRYSNAGYAVAASLAERTTGLSWEQLMQTRLFGPLGVDAAYGWPLAQSSEEPWGHRISGGVATPHDPTDGYAVPAVLAPAGDVSMCISDYARFACMHLAGLEGKGGSVCSDELIQRLHQPVLEYSCGWHEQIIDDERTSWHRGTCDTFDTYVLLQPSRDVGIIAFANADGDDAAAKALFAELTTLSAVYAARQAP